MALKSIKDFPKATPSTEDLILIEQQGGGRSTPLSEMPVSTPVNTKITGEVNSLKSRIDNIVASSGDYISEIVDARQGSDGTNYTSLKARLDAENNQLKGDLVANVGNERITSWSAKGKYIKTDNGVGSTISLSELSYGSSLRYVILDCSEGDKFVVNGRGDGEARLFCFVDENNVCLYVSTNNYVADNIVITAPSGSSKLIINDKTSSDSYIGNFLIDRVNIIQDSLKNFPSHITLSVSSGKVSDLRSLGWYTLTAKLTDFPNDFIGSNGFLIVYPNSLSGHIYQELHSSTQIYHRIISNEGDAISDWNKVGNVFSSDLSVFPKRVQSTGVYSGKASDLRSLGWYGTTAKLEDFPSDFNGNNGVLFVYTDTINHLIYQELHDTTQIWHRIIDNEGNAISD